MRTRDALSLPTWVRAARLVLPEPVTVTGLTALQLQGLDYGTSLPLQFVTDRPTQTRRSGLRLRVRSSADLSRPIASVPDAFAEVCQTASRLDAVVIGDRLVHLRMTSPEALVHAAQQAGPRAQWAAGLVRRGAESVRETQVRLALVLAGLPEPALQYRLADQEGMIGRFDMVCPTEELIIEYDGDQHRTDQRQWQTDINRLDRAGALGYTTIRITAQHFREPWTQVVRVHEALVNRGFRGPGPVRTAVWEECFGQAGRR